jgi:hypothetical protein
METPVTQPFFVNQGMLSINLLSEVFSDVSLSKLPKQRYRENWNQPVLLLELLY